MFTRQHYVAIAKEIATLSCEGERARFAGKMAKIFEKDNPLFKRSTFYAACCVPLPEKLEK
jgi:hypothetical protein